MNAPAPLLEVRDLRKWYAVRGGIIPRIRSHVRAVEQRRHRKLFGHLAGIHHDGALGDLADHAEIVRDEDDRHAAALLQAPQQREDLRLDGDVERRGRLVGDQDLRVAGERDRDYDALAHAAGKLVRVAREAFRRIGDAELGEQVARPRPCGTHIERLVLALIITVMVGPSLQNLVLVLGFVMWPVVARLVRGQALAVREHAYIEAAVAAGGSSLWIIRRHVWPNIFRIVAAQFAITVSFAIITSASLSFLGLGIPPPVPDWGSMVRSGFDVLAINPALSLAPGAAMATLVLGFYLMGNSGK